MYDYSFALWSIVWKKLLSLTVYLLTQVYKSSHVYRETRKPKQSGRDEYVGELCKSVVFSFGNYKSNKDNDRSSKSYDPKIHDRLLYRFEIYGSGQNDCVFYTSLADTWSNGKSIKNRQDRFQSRIESIQSLRNLERGSKFGIFRGKAVFKLRCSISWNA